MGNNVVCQLKIIMENTLVAKEKRALLVFCLCLIAMLSGSQISSPSKYVGGFISIFWILLFGYLIWRALPEPPYQLFICLLLFSFIDVKGLLQINTITSLTDKFIKNFWGQMLAFLFLYYLTKQIMTKRKAPQNNITLACFGMILFTLGGFIASNNAIYEKPYCRLMWQEVCVLGFLTLYVTYETIENAKQAERGLKIIVAITTLYGLLFLILIPRLQPYAQEGTESFIGRLAGNVAFSLPTIFRTSVKLGLSSNAVHLGTYLSLGMVCAFHYFVAGRVRRVRFFCLGAFVLMTIVILSAQARGAVLGTIVGCLIIYLLNYYKHLSKSKILLLKIIFFLVLIVGIASYIISWRTSLDPTGGSYEGRWREIKTPFQAVNVTGRIRLWEAAWESISKNPWGTGFAEPFVSSYAANPHNIFLWVLQGSGWIGFIGFTIVLFLLIRAFMRGIKQNNNLTSFYSILGIGMLIAVMVQGIACVIFETSPITIAFWAIMGICLSACIKIGHEKANA